MLQEATLGDDGQSQDLDRIRHEFLSFLDDERPPMFVAETLTLLFDSTVAPRVSPATVTAWIEDWCGERSRAVRRPRYEVLLGVVERVMNAYRSNAIQGFDSFSFMERFGLRLGALCSPAEQPAFRAGARKLIENLPQAAVEGQPESASAPEHPTDAERSLKERQEDVLTKLEHQAYMSQEEFDRVIHDLDEVLSTRLGYPVQASLKRILRAATQIFNTGRVEQAARLTDLIQDRFMRFVLSREECNEIRAAIREGELNEGQLTRSLATPEQRHAAESMIRSVLYFSPNEALIALGHEKRRERRRLLLSGIEVFGPEAFPKVLSELQAARKGDQPWYFVRNLLYLASKLECPDDASRKTAIEAAGPYVAHDQPQLRAAAVVTLAKLGGRESITYLVRALDPGSYPAGSIDDSESLRRHLHMVMEALFESGADSAAAIIAEFATGVRGADFDLGHHLRDDACAVLGLRKAPLPPRAVEVVVTQLHQMVSKKLKIVTGMLSLGIDPHACKQLADLIRDSTDVRAKEILEHQVLQKVLARA